jgi:hypothetical protein
LLVQIEQIEIGAGQFPQGPPQQKTWTFNTSLFPCFTPYI